MTGKSPSQSQVTDIVVFGHLTSAYERICTVCQDVRYIELGRELQKSKKYRRQEGHHCAYGI